jgi:hypothetical protein
MRGGYDVTELSEQSIHLSILPNSVLRLPSSNSVNGDPWTLTSTRI